MSVSAISTNSLIQSSNQKTPINLQQFQKDFQQLGSDLQNGNLSTANQEFSSLQALVPGSNSVSPTQSYSPVVQSFNQLGQDIQSGGLTAAKQDFGTLKTDLQKIALNHSHHRVHDPMETAQGNDQLGQTLQASNASSAQSAYSSLLQGIQQYGPGSLASLTPDLPTLSSSSFSASA
jgi:hypothetical protein